MSFGKIKSLLLALLIACGIATQAKSQGVITTDVSNVPPELGAICLEAEAIWEERLIGISSALPNAIRTQLTSLQISCFVVAVDGPGGGLAFAGPDAILAFQPPLSFNEETTVSFPVVSSMFFDIADSQPTNEEERIFLLETAIHEMGHCLGIGSLWTQNGLIGNTNPATNGLTQYIGGAFAIEEYRKAINEPFAQFVPLEQAGGPGSALSHWARVPGLDFPETNEQDILLAFAGFFNDAGELIIPRNVITEITYGGMADLGFAVSGINEELLAPPGTGTGTWPKITGSGNNPFDDNGVAAAAGLSFRSVNIKAILRLDKATGERKIEIANTDEVDPYNLRDLRWSQSNSASGSRNSGNSRNSTSGANFLKLAAKKLAENAAKESAAKK